MSDSYDSETKEQLDQRAMKFNSQEFFSEEGKTSMYRIQ